jgi:hypothetical protein
MGQADYSTVWIDSTTAGYNWFIDPTSSDYSDYGYDPGDGKVVGHNRK